MLTEKGNIQKNIRIFGLVKLLPNRIFGIIDSPMETIMPLPVVPIVLILCF